MAGFSTRHGIHDEAQRKRIADIIKQVETDGIRTVRLGFADQHGVVRGKSFAADQIGSLFEDGMTAPSSLLLKDLAHRTVLPVWNGNRPGLPAWQASGHSSDPDPDRFHILPWMGTPPGFRPISFTPMATLLLSTRAASQGVQMPALSRLACSSMPGWKSRHMSIALPTAAEYIRYRAARHAAGGGNPEPWISASDRALRRHARTGDDAHSRDLRSLAIPIRSLEVEFGPSQIEFTCAARPGIAAADDMVLLRSALRQTLARHGYHISFMCRPAIDGSFASGWHLHQSVADSGGTNLFTPAEDGAMTDTASGWIAGLLHHAPA